ncbi:MAG: hypothetical protein J6B77_07310, partial [Clostridia bacterium]|nr:hypothetical protein [Clostridia bacterium]
MKLTVSDGGLSGHAALLRKHIARRIAVEEAPGGMRVSLSVDPTLGAPESYRISHAAGVWQITGTDESGLYFGIGKFLHTAVWTENGFTPKETGRVIAPACSFRAIYFAVHLYNYYANAPTAELAEYLEELLLWGYNGIVLIIPVIDLETFDDPLFHSAVEKSRTIFGLAKSRGIQCGIIICPNQGVKSSPHRFDADPSFDPIGNVRGNAGRNLCPSKPGARAHLREIWDTMLSQYADVGLDYLVTWPYDEGGCGCAECRPWGARAYPDLAKELFAMAKAYYPKLQTIISAWIFDRPDDQGEYAGLYARLNGDLKDTDYIMVDAHGSYPRYPLEHPVVKPVVNFPEISMWKLYPWGGFGANPLPERFHAIWNSAKAILGGGMPYSEGMYEDISKIQFAGYYWEPDRAWEDIFAEYIGYECASDPDVIADAIEMIRLIEKNHVLVGEGSAPDYGASDRADALARSIDARLGGRKPWRWRILYVRAVTDKKRY